MIGVVYEDISAERWETRCMKNCSWLKSSMSVHNVNYYSSDEKFIYSQFELSTHSSKQFII